MLLLSLIGTLDKRAGEISEVAHSIEQYDWHMMEVYENPLRFIVEAASPPNSKMRGEQLREEGGRVTLTMMTGREVRGIDL